MSNQELNLTQDLDNVEKILSSLLTGSEYEASVNNMCLQVVKAGGKRIRPRLVILSWRALNKQNSEYEHMLQFAASTELLHTASLVHDDVIDKATIRRGKATLNDTDGNHAAVLAGDYLFTRCFFCMHEINNKDLSILLNDTLAALVMGEINQLHNQGKIDITIPEYEQTIYAKTGALFELATAGCAILNNEPQNIVDAMKEYGKQLGIAFQVADDMLDYTSSTEHLGKSIGEDLEDGRITLPLILALRDCDANEKSKLERAITECNLEYILDIINKTGSIAKCQEFALQAVDKAINAIDLLDDTPYKAELGKLAFKAANRSK